MRIGKIFALNKLIAIKNLLITNDLRKILISIISNYRTKQHFSFSFLSYLMIFIEIYQIIHYLKTFYITLILKKEEKKKIVLIVVY